MTDQAQTTTEPVENLSAKLTAIRDKFLIPTPDKDFTDYAVLTRCIEALALAEPAEGYVLVPVEPTEAMIDAADTMGNRLAGSDIGTDDMTRYIWSAMIAACLPAAPTGETGA